MVLCKCPVKIHTYIQHGGTTRTVKYRLQHHEPVCTLCSTLLPGDWNGLIPSHALYLLTAFWNVMGCDGMWWDVMGCDGMWWDVMDKVGRLQKCTCTYIHTYMHTYKVPIYLPVCGSQIQIQIEIVRLEISCSVIGRSRCPHPHLPPILQ
jgi:hypothetical protein